MKHIITFTILFSLFSCNENKETGKENVMVDLKHLCNNQIFLLENPKSNWEIPLDSIDNYNEFIYHARVQNGKCEFHRITSDSFDSQDLIDVNKFYGSNVYPYIKVNGMDVSLCQLLVTSSGGYFANAKNIIRINYYSKKQFERENWKEKIYKYYIGLKGTDIVDSLSSNRLEVPLIILSFHGEAFKYITTILKEITEGYITVIDSISKEKFGKDACTLTSNQIKIIKSEYPLNIRLIRMS
ncbi:MAG: hypothetical protein NVV82_12060 [Sporocytophaga sp.]|nr:hypothetical protein [Sporocytophaga sp.]